MGKRDGRGGGSAIIELSMVASVLVVMALLCANLTVVGLATSVNDSACRDAARAAAQASSPGQALSLAQAAIKAHHADGYYISQPTIDSSAFVYQDFAGAPPLDTSPYVEVTTSTDVRIPCPLIFLGAQFSKRGTLTFRRTYTFPIVKTQLYLN